MPIQTFNPSTGIALKTYTCLPNVDIDALIQAAHKTYQTWHKTSVQERAKHMSRLADLLIKNKDKYAALIATEMGKPITSGRAEIEKCALACRHYATHSATYLAPRTIQTEATKSYICYEPTGLLFAIMPWNFPFWQVFRCAAPNLMAGNGVILKHAPIVTGCALAIEDLFREAGFPAGIFLTLVIDEEQAKQVIAHPHIIGVTLTGSERAGKAVAAEAGKHTKKVVLELGGNDPYLILEDADLEQAAEICLQSRLANSGQVCIAAKRLIVVASIKEVFQKYVMAQLDRYTMGDPLDEHIQLGPLARADLRKKLHQQIQISVSQGARLVCGGRVPTGKGFYYPITVLDNVKEGMLACEDELFGPVITFITAKDEADAIRIANNSRYGLGAAIFTRDSARGEKIAATQLKAGSCFVNKSVTSDARLPFGGTKSSGFGRELAEVGMHEFMNIKTVVVR